MSELRAGVARTTITPPLGTYLIGYADRTRGCNAVHDDLTATAVVLEDESTRLALIALDMLCLNEHPVARIRERIAAEIPIPERNVMVCCSHTHAAPIAYADRLSRPKRRRVIDSIVSRAVEVTREADAKRRRVAASTGEGQARIAVNRREKSPEGKIVLGVNPDGPVDRSLRVIQLRDESDRLVLTLVNFACHGTVLGPTNRGVSGDWPGAMRRALEAATGAPCLFVQGATGNLNPNHEWGPDELAGKEQLGRAVAQSVEGILAEGLSPLRATPLRACSETFWLPTIPRFDSKGRELSYRTLASRLVHVPRVLIDPLLRARYPWKATTRRGENGHPELALEIQAFRLGECAILALAAETFNEIGQQIKEGSPFPHTLFAGYTNGCVGYITTAEAHAEGGYEVEEAPLAYRMSGLYHPENGQAVTKRSLELLTSLAD